MWKELMRFDGELTLDELNQAYANEIGEDGAKYAEDEEAYKKAIKEGWIEFKDGNTIIWEDGI